jgi:hypothetical protein
MALRRGVAISLGCLGLAIAAFAIERYRRHAAQGAKRKELLALATTELGRRPLDRAGIQDALRALAKDDRLAQEPEVVRARAELELAAGRPQAALDLVQVALHSGVPAPEDQILGAKIFAARAGLTGDIDDAKRASTLAEDHFTATGQHESLFLAWQCATRIEDRDRASTLADRLQAEAGDTTSGRLVRGLLSLDTERAQAAAALRALEREVDEIPPELDVALATLELEDEDQNVRLHGLQRVEAVLARLPTFVGARIVAAYAFDRTGDATTRDAHLRWLVEHHPADPRAESWRALLDRGR